MKSRTISLTFSAASSDHEVIVGERLLRNAGRWARRCLGPRTRQIVVVSNPTVFSLYGKQTESSLGSAGFTVSHFLMRDGERFKTLKTAETGWAFLSEKHITRGDAIVALGGGVVGDLAGFIAATYLRGIDFLQIPTTLLAMVDASVGGKTGVNTAFGKNLVGAFHQPRGILIDIEVLQTLSTRDLNAGLFEIVKHATLSGRRSMAALMRFLTDRPEGGLVELIDESIRFKASVVSRDKQESVGDSGSGSRKILNFGHTLAHALEKVTEYKRFRHGEAVGHGILFAAELSKSLALLGEKDVNLLYDVVHRVGPMPSLAGIGEDATMDAFSFDKKNRSGSLEMVLLKGIGMPVITNDIPRPTLKRVLKKFLQDRA